MSNTIDNVIGLISEGKESMLQTLIDDSPFKILIKGAHNDIIQTNELAAQGMGGDSNDFVGKEYL